jgi:hypothetical protein
MKIDLDPALDAVQRGRLAVYGSDEPVGALQQALPGIRAAPRRASAPVNVAPWLWDWRHRLQRRLEAGGRLSRRPVDPPHRTHRPAARSRVPD